MNLSILKRKGLPFNRRVFRFFSEQIYKLPEGSKMPFGLALLKGLLFRQFKLFFLSYVLKTKGDTFADTIGVWYDFSTDSYWFLDHNIKGKIFREHIAKLYEEDKNKERQI